MLVEMKVSVLQLAFSDATLLGVLWSLITGSNKEVPHLVFAGVDENGATVFFWVLDLNRIVIVEKCSVLLG